MDFLGLSISQIATIVSVGLTVACSVLGPKYVKMKKLVTTIVDSIEDEDLSKDELKKIIKQIKKL